MSEKQRDKFYEELDKQVPEWRRINNDPEFTEWLNQRDEQTGKLRQDLFLKAYNMLDVSSMISFFKEYIRERIMHEPTEENPDPIPYKQRDFISKDFEVYDVLGMGGFGVVYLVYSHETESVYALKTFRDEYLEEAQTRDRFRKEAQVWIDLDRHPYLVRAYLVDEISGRLFIALEYIAPDEHGLNSLEGYLKSTPPDLAQSLRWGIQFCHGMEYAYSKGIRAHRDIKPANIMISQNKTIKISDFGLAGVIGASKAISGLKLCIQKGRVGLSCQTMEGTGFGTPTHMPPEQFTNAANCDERSDIYSFGIVLYQMATSGKLPFIATLPRDYSEEETKRFWTQMYMLHSKALLPKVNSPLFPVIQRCLEKELHRRYRSFKELRLDLEKLLKQETGEVLNLPGLHELEAWELNNKGTSLYKLHRFNEAILCFNKALEIDPRDTKFLNNKGICLDSLGRYDDAILCLNKALEIKQCGAIPWHNKGRCLANLGRYDEAILCCDKALEIDPRDTVAWSIKGVNLANLGRYDEAILCCDKALEIDPRDREAWNTKGVSLCNLGRYDEVILCCDKVLEIDPWYTVAWSNKGVSLASLGRYDDALICYNKALEIDPQDIRAWINKGLSLANLGRYDEAILCYDRALEIDPQYVSAWTGKGSNLRALGRNEEAIYCQDKALEIEPRNQEAWYNKGSTLCYRLGRYEEALYCYDKVLEIDPRNVQAWNSKAVSLGNLGRFDEAIICYDRALEIDPQYVFAWTGKGTSLRGLGRNEEAIYCYDKVLKIDPHYITAYFLKALAEEKIVGRRQDAIRSYQQFIILAPSQYRVQIENARQRLQELEK